MNKEVEYVLIAKLDGEEVYKQSDPNLEVIEQSLEYAKLAVEKEL